MYVDRVQGVWLPHALNLKSLRTPDDTSSLTYCAALGIRIITPNLPQINGLEGLNVHTCIINNGSSMATKGIPDLKVVLVCKELGFDNCTIRNPYKPLRKTCWQ